MNPWFELLQSSPSFASWLTPPTHSSDLSEVGDSDLTEFLRLLALSDRRLVVDGLDLLAGGYVELLTRIYGEIFGQFRLRRSTEVIETGPAIVGNPLWAKTLLSRMTGLIPPGKLYSRVTKKDLNVEENIAVRLLIDGLHQSAADIEARLRKRTHPIVGSILEACELIQAEIEFQSIPSRMDVSERLIAAAEDSDLGIYRSVGSALRRRTLVSDLDDLARWKRVCLSVGLSKVAHVPQDEEALFEVLALSRVLDALEIDLGFGKPVSYWMRINTGTSTGPVARFFDENRGSVEVYFNRCPARFLTVSTHYSAVFESHEGLPKYAERRPDVSLVFEPNDGSGLRVLFVEAKLPSSGLPGDYLRQSIYKCFGYLHDFQNLWQPDQGARVILFSPYAIRHVDRDEQVSLIIVDARNRADLAKWVRSAFGT